MLRISLIVFAVGNFLLPWSNRITGPIEEQGHSLASASGMGSGLPGIGSGMELHDLGFCGFNNSEETVNVNSVKRLPASVWGFLLFVTVLTILARYEYTHTHTHTREEGMRICGPCMGGCL